MVLYTGFLLSVEMSLRLICTKVAAISLFAFGWENDIIGHCNTKVINLRRNIISSCLSTEVSLDRESVKYPYKKYNQLITYTYVISLLLMQQRALHFHEYYKINYCMCLVIICFRLL